MAKDPSLRYQTAEEFQQRLDRLGKGPQPAVEPLQRPVPLAEPAVLRKRTMGFVVRIPRLKWGSWRLWAASFFTFIVVVLTFLAIAKRL
jgi:hypothetical protein